jgi:phage terminase small subunit
MYMKNTTNEVLEGEVIESPYVHTIQDNNDNVNKPRNTKLSVKASKFVKNYIEGDTMGNGTKSAIKAGYSEISASSYASQLLKSPKVLAVLNGKVEEAERVISDLMYTSESDAIRLSAAKEVLDRTVGKAVQRSESTNVHITVEMMLDDTV